MRLVRNMNETRQPDNNAAYARTASHGSLALLSLGIATWWPLFRTYEYSALFTLYPNPVEAMWNAYTPTMVLLGLFLLLGAAVHTTVERLVSRHRLACCLTCAATTLGWLLTYLTGTLESAPIVLRILGMACIALGYGALSFCWGASLCSTPGKQTAMGFAGGIVLSTVTQLTALLPNTATLCIAALAPAVSAACWITYKPEEHTSPQSARPRQKMPIAVIAMLGGFLVVGRVAVGLLSYALTAIPMLDRFATVAATLALIFSLAMGGSCSNDWGRLFQVSWSGLAIVFMAGMFSLFIGNEAVSHLATSILYATLSSFELMLFVILSLCAYSNGASGVLVFGISVSLFRVLPNFVGKTLAPLLLHAGPQCAQQITAFVVPVMTFMLVVATIVFMNARIMGKVAWFGETPATSLEDMGAFSTPEMPSGVTQVDSAHKPTPEDACHTLAAEHGLTPRETDVLILMSEGRSYQKIADTLCISLGTVQGHVKCVYRKLGVHTKQEVIELVK